MATKKKAKAPKLKGKVVSCHAKKTDAKKAREKKSEANKSKGVMFRVVKKKNKAGETVKGYCVRRYKK